MSEATKKMTPRATSRVGVPFRRLAKAPRVSTDDRRRKSMARCAMVIAISVLVAPSKEKVASVAVCQITPTTPVAMMAAL